MAIIDNAIEAGRFEHNISSLLYITTQTQIKNKKKWLLVSFRNNGKLIDPSIVSHIFEPFYTTKDVGKGFGLGLSICYNIVQLHGGVIELVNSAGFVEFIIRLPLDKN